MDTVLLTCGRVLLKVLLEAATIPIFCHLNQSSKYSSAPNLLKPRGVAKSMGMIYSEEYCNITDQGEILLLLKNREGLSTLFGGTRVDHKNIKFQGIRIVAFTIHDSRFFSNSG
jgi:hypothetical protein